MFGKLKEKLKSALSIFSKKAEEEASVKEAPAEKKEILVSKPVEPRIEDSATKKIMEIVKKDYAEEEKQKIREKVAEKFVKKEEAGKEEKREEVTKKETKKEKISEDEVLITYFAHGTTFDNEKEISSGWSDADISEKGIKQSIELKGQTKDKKFDLVYCSDLKRAVHSAKLTFEGKVKIIPDKRLRECNYGDYNGKPSKIVEPLQEKSVSKPMPNGESYEDVKQRIAEFLNGVYEKYRGKHIAIVAHKAPQLAIEVLLNNKTWEEAFAEDWRKRKAWQPGWDYIIKNKIETEIPVPETFNPATMKYEPDVTKIKEISQEEEIEKPPEEKKSFFGKLKEAFTTKTISAEKFEELFWELEVILLENNVSVEVIDKIKDDLKKELVDKPLPRDVESKIEETLQRTLREILTFDKIDLVEEIQKKEKKPYIIAFFGINGSGKTTSIAKLAHYLQKNKISVVLAAGDTFRAAAIQQLEEHADKLGIKMIKHDYGSDAAAVAFDAVKYADKNKIDAVLIDTAGRLHSNTNLMAELEKIIRVTQPDLKLFVGESITGNDCIEQARQFDEMVEVDGAILTKADVDEKGGAPLSIAYTIKKPILFMGMGQRYQDFEEFDREKMLKRLGF